MSTDSGGQTHRSQTRQRETEDVDVDVASTETADRVEKLQEDSDSLLDEIDSVLEENAEEFVRGYVQKGGQ
jgi:ubiquitin-like protein Pup